MSTAVLLLQVLDYQAILAGWAAVQTGRAAAAGGRWEPGTGEAAAVIPPPVLHLNKTFKHSNIAR